MQFFYDTNVLLQKDTSFDPFNQQEQFYISNVTIEQLEQIKNSDTKNSEIKYLARKASRWLINNQNKYNVIIYDNIEGDFPYLIDSPDKKILASVLYIIKNNKNITFLTSDFNCYLLAKTLNINTQLLKPYRKTEYNGYRKVICSTDEELADFYTRINSYSNKDFEDLNINEYLLIYDCNDNLIDKYKYLGKGNFSQVNFISAESKMFGKIKPIDPYQQLLMDSFKTNQLTLVKGAAGTGKSLLSLAYLFRLLEKGSIDRIIIFCNTIATAGSAKLGYYPGNRTQKLLDSQIGNFLISKLGAREQVERLIDIGQLLLLPMSDIRGFDTSGMRAGIYITQAQNLSIELMKLALQRIGQDSICILDGDKDTQVDLNLYSGENNGLKRVSEVFRGQSFYGEVTLKIVHRSKIAAIAGKM